MNSIKKAVESIKEFVSQKGRFAFVASAILVILFISAMIVSIAQCGTKSKKTKTFETKEPDISVENLVPPSSSAISNDYYFSRVPNDEWSDDEVEKWFTEPSQKEVDELGSANEALVQSITEASP